MSLNNFNISITEPNYGSLNQIKTNQTKPISVNKNTEQQFVKSINLW